MPLEKEPKNIHQYCFSLRNQEVVSTGLGNNMSLFKRHRLIYAYKLPVETVQYFETWISGLLRGNNIDVENLRLDFIGRSGLINYAIFADSRNNPTKRLKRLKGFSSVSDETSQLTPF